MAVNTKTMNGPTRLRRPAHNMLRMRGFTLIEITIAVFNRALALTTLIGLESAVVDRSLFDRNNLRAMLFARRILAQFESENSGFEIQDRTVPAKELLLAGSGDPQEELELEDLTASLKIEEWPTPFKENALKRISLTVRWSPAPRDALSLYYFVPFDETQTPRGDEEEDG